MVDIDDTILTAKLVNGHYEIGDYNDDLIATVNQHYDNGDVVIIWTGRHWNHLEDTLAQLRASRIKYHSLVMGKPVADLYIDDKAVRPDEFLDR